MKQTTKEPISEYETQANDFLKQTDTTFKVTFVRHGLYFDDEKETRDIYQFEFKRGERTFKGTFGQSISNSCFKVFRKQFPETEYNTDDCNKTDLKKFLKDALIKFGNFSNLKVNKMYVYPTAYDVLSCITKNDPMDFKNFCGDYGYSDDSIKATKIYKAVCEEWLNVQKIWTDEEIKLMQEIN